MNLFLKREISNIAAGFNVQELYFDQSVTDSTQIQYTPVHLHQILSNLLSNAFDVSESVQVKVEKQEFDEDLNGTPDLIPANKYFTISVTDYGSGIPQENISKVFTPFFTTKNDGHGIGLSGVLRLAGLNDSYIQVESELGTGSSFKLYINAN